MATFQNKFNITAMAALRQKSRHHHRIFTQKSEDDIASLLVLPNMDAHKLWNLTSHSKESMIKEVLFQIPKCFFSWSVLNGLLSFNCWRASLKNRDVRTRGYHKQIRFLDWERSNWSSPTFQCWFGRNVTCDDRGHWTATLTTMGVCQTYILSKPNLIFSLENINSKSRKTVWFISLADDSLVHLAGIYHSLYLQLQESETDYYKGDSGWKFHIHDPKEVPILAVTTHGTSLYPGQGRDLRLEMKKVS